MKGNKRGFTLIELMITSLILTVIIGAVYNSLRTGLGAYQREEVTSLVFQNARFALRGMAKEIRSAYVNPHNPRIRFLGTDETFEGEDTDRLDFARGHDLRGISYFLDNDPGTPEKWLQREERISPYLSEEEEFPAPGESEEMADSVRALNFRYYAQGEWHDSWDSPSLPRAVQITLTFEILPNKRWAETRRETFSLVVNLALARTR